MNIDWTEIIISLCSLLITGIIVPIALTKYKEIKSNMREKNAKEVEYWTKVAVRWAKQWLQSETGQKKKSEVLQYLSKKLIELNINISGEDLDKIIEAVYGEIKDSLASQKELELEAPEM